MVIDDKIKIWIEDDRGPVVTQMRGIVGDRYSGEKNIVDINRFNVGNNFIRIGFIPVRANRKNFFQEISAGEYETICSKSINIIEEAGMYRIIFKDRPLGIQYV